MSKKRTFQGHDISIPNKLNIAIFIVMVPIAMALLYTASHTEQWWVIGLCAIAFAQVNITIFSLLHDATHHTLHSNQKVNNLIGILVSPFFPTGYTFQKICHLGHHQRNRTDAEMFEAYNNRDNKLIKNISLYTILTGIYWTNPPLGALFFMLMPDLVRESDMIRGKGKYGYSMQRIGAHHMLLPFDGLGTKKINFIRLEILYSLLFQVGMILALDISFVGWMSCYAIFALNWSGLQYADHAYSVRDIRNGAWNLKVNKATQYIFLNYHHHLAHHQYPQVPWLHLAKFVDFEADRPSFIKIYMRMWKGLVYTDEEAPKGIDKDLIPLIDVKNFV